MLLPGLLALLLLSSSCSPASQSAAVTQTAATPGVSSAATPISNSSNRPDAALVPFTITSPDFKDGGSLPQKAVSPRCSGSNAAPTFQWTNVPAKAKSFILLMTDYDAPYAGGLHHWVVYNIPASAREMTGNQPFTEGTSSMHIMTYTGPCPTATGEIHHYLFSFYAADVASIGGKGLTYDQVLSALQGHVVGVTSMVGTFRLSH
ncbi:MAG TPA: YbhB/YbcL family Raf kinase inhibitor-like protein [Ktedonobacteraceae bacterium]